MPAEKSNNSNDSMRIDSHKLMFHPDRVAKWLSGENIYPVYMEVSPSGACNHRCTFCALDFMKYRPKFLDTDIFKARLTEMGRLGLKSIMYGGEGEPFLHKKMPEITRHTFESGIDAAFTSNGVLLDKERAEKVLPFTKWIKISFTAGTAKNYALLHRTQIEDFERVIKNLSHAVTLREKHGYDCALGFQMLLLPENESEAVELAKICSDIGVDYLVIKPYSQHPQSETDQYSNVTYKDKLELAEKLQEYSSENFKVIFRTNTMKKYDETDRGYKQCQALPFWSYIDSEGNVYGCSMFLTDEQFVYGNIHDQTFESIWTSKKRLNHLSWVDKELNTSECRLNCRMDEINRYLWELKNPHSHVNFI